MRKLGRIVLRVAVALAILLVVCAIAGLLVIRSGWFHERVRQRIIAEIEKATGGRVEVGNFSFDSANLVATVSPLALHGREPAGESPLVEIKAVKVGLRVISMMERKIDLASVHIDHPSLRIVFYPDGTTNLPTRGSATGNWAESLLSAAVRHYEITDGVIEYDNRKMPLNLRGEDLRLQMTYEAQGPVYRGEFASRRVRVMPAGLPPMEVDASGTFTLRKSEIEFGRMRLATKESRADLSGTLSDLRAPHGTFNLKAAIGVREAAAMLQLPIEHRGSAAFDGKLSISFAEPFDFGIAGRLNARSLGYKRDRLDIEGADLRADVRLTLEKVTFTGVKLAALDANVTGQGELAKWKDFHFEGSFEGLSVREAAKVSTDRAIAWNGMMAGDFEANATLGQETAKAHTIAGITPIAGGTPIEGRLDISYDQAASSLKLGNSFLTTAATRIELTGTLGETLQVHAVSSNLDDVLPALDLASDHPPKELPLKLINGRASFDGTVSGPLDDPVFSGQASLTNASISGHPFDRFTGDIAASAHSVKFQHFVLGRGVTEIDGSGEITPKEGKFDDAVLAGRLNVRNAQLTELAKEAGISAAISGTAAGTVRVFGSLLRPEAEMDVQLEKPAAFGEQVDRLNAKVKYSSENIDVTAGEADTGSGKLRFQGGFRHPDGDWKNGEVRFDLTAEKLPISRADAISKLQPGLDGILEGKASGTARLAKGELTATSVTAGISVKSVTFEHDQLGDVSLTAETRGAELTVHAEARILGSNVQGQGSWRLAGDDPGSATIRFARTSIETLHRLVMIGGTPAQQNSVPPFEGFIDGGATISVALAKPRDFTAQITLDALQLNPKPAQTLRLGVQQPDLVLKNSKPVVLTVSAKEARITSAQFSARDTSLEVTGTLPLTGKTGADLAVRGSVNLIILQLLNPDLVAAGNATVQASVRGSLQDPQLTGRMELNKASLYLSDLPNGVDNASGAVVFDRNRATIEKLTAETGGGKVNFTGFIGFGSILVYRLQATAQNVRVRYPEDVSVTFNATLALNGTSDSSTASGTMTLNRASFTPRADLAQILAQTTRPAAAQVTNNEYVQGMQFDIRIESGPNFEFQTSLTRNVEAEIDLRLRGTPLRPVLLGTASVSQGEVQVFGNRYTVNRGDVRFVNPVKIDPIFDMDLETKARGVTVNIALSGSLQKLNVNYSSDPPMQPREIIALLAVGRSPTDTAGLTSNQPSTGSTSLVEAGGSLLGQAVSAQLSSRLQRFFGASRVRIDPELTGADYLPQARLTIEQQVSKDITLTYITNLNRTQEQIVQIEWDFSRQWSAIAVREANGLFGVDFQYKKRFK